MKRIVLTAVLGVAGLAIAALAAFVLLAPPIIGPCFDSGGWWNRAAGKCECTYAERADPKLNRERKAYCEAHPQGPAS